MPAFVDIYSEKLSKRKRFLILPSLKPIIAEGYREKFVFEDAGYGGAQLYIARCRPNDIGTRVYRADIASNPTDPELTLAATVFPGKPFERDISKDGRVVGSFTVRHVVNLFADTPCRMPDMSELYYKHTELEQS